MIKIMALNTKRALGLVCLYFSATTAATSSREPIHLSLTGHIDPSQVFSFVYVPFQVEEGVTSISVLQNYSLKGDGNSLDLGLFDQRGIEVPDEFGQFGTRGWSGGFRNNFTITPAWATPGYNPGPISPGTWNVALGPYESTAQGIDWTLQISLGFEPTNATFTPTYATTNMDPICNGCTETEDFTWQRGDFHMHTVYSDGKYTPEQQLATAKAQNLSFVFLSDHNTDTSNQIAGSIQVAHAPDLLVCRAIEVTTRYGHWHAVGLDRAQVIDWRYKPGDEPGFAQAAEQVRRAGGFVSANHPFAECPACDWSLGWEDIDAVEVWNGVWDGTDEQAVAKWQSLLVDGKRMTAVGGSDSHSPPSVNGLPTSVVKGRGRSQAAIVEGVKAGRVYLLEGPGMDVGFEVVAGSLRVPAQIGDKLEIGAKGAQVAFSAEGLVGQRACLVSDQGYFHNASIVDAQQVRHEIPSGAKFVRMEVRNSTSDDMLALTNPVWFLA